MTRTLMTILALSLIPMACGTPTATSPDAALSAGSSSGTVTSSGFGGRLTPTGKCVALAIDLSASQDKDRMLITGVFTDGQGNPVSSAGCDAMSWSVSPDGAYVIPVSAGREGPTIVQLVAVGIDQMYTVTAAASTLTASIDVSFERPR